MNPDFDWPTPPHFEPITKLIAGSPEPGIVVMNDGRRQSGTMIRLDTSESILEFHPGRAPANLSIGFSAFKSLLLTQLIEFKRLHLAGLSESAGITPISEKQKCVVRFKDGDNLIAETMGFVAHKAGLFLFLVNYSNHVLRWFLPAETIESYQIGDQLGKILIDEKILTPELIDAGLEKQQQLRSKKLGDYLKDENIVTQQEIEAALENQRAMPQLKLGEALLLEKVITRKQLDDALQTQSQDRKLRLGEVLISMGVVNKEAITRVLVQKLGIPFVNLQKFQFDLNVIKTVPADLARKHKLIPLYCMESRIIVAMENPLAWDSLQELGMYTKQKVDPVLATSEELSRAIERFYSPLAGKEAISDLVSELETSTESADDLPADVITESDSLLVRLVNKIILDAFKQGASDIHIESSRDNKPSKVRFRKDGVMMPYSEVPANFRTALISRIKIMSHLDISEKRHAQDGKLNFEQFGPAKIELRIVTIPTANGLENVVMRILAAPKAVSIDSIGLAPASLAKLKELAVKPHGLIFVCGPTGSGKTTTLHAVLGYINTPERKIWTVEDPIEISQEGLCQVQVQAKIGWTFATVLRSFLRADPDVIMVGETRDAETAKTAIEASLTGHLVLSTMHTNSASESVVRLLDLGLDPFTFADALRAVIGQRLARRLCSACRKPHTVTEEEINILAQEYCWETEINPADVLQRWLKEYASDDGTLTLFSPTGCSQCDQTGYKGRVGIHELLVASSTITKKIHTRANVAEILRTAMAEGMRTLKQDGIDKVLQGHTDMEQIQAVCL